ncbi:MAG: hypothetical protein AAGA54_04735 [Myxococcota bacterium]
MAPSSTTGSITTGASTSTGSSSETTQPPDSTTRTGSTSTTSSTDASGASDSRGNAGFVIDVDAGPSPFECSPLEQDCRRGEKCTAWINDGGVAFNATRCVPVTDAPDQPGEPCAYEEAFGSGFDSCSADSICTTVNVGSTDLVCVPFCTGSIEAPLCESPFEECWLTESGPPLCLPFCDPLSQPASCGPGQGCYIAGNLPTCAPDASGDQGALFETCEFINRCDPGLTCEAADRVGFCEPEATGCCTPFCDPSAPDCPVSMECEMVEGGGSPPAPQPYGVCVLSG